MVFTSVMTAWNWKSERCTASILLYFSRMKLDNLDTFRELVRSQLSRGVIDRRHGFHWPSLASVDSYLRATQRTVVLRGMDWSARKIWCFTDRRTAKISDLNQHGPGSLSWLFFDRSKNLQVRVAGQTFLLTGSEAEPYREKIPPKKFRDYVSRVTPGGVIRHPRYADPRGDVSTEDMEKNFCVVSTRFEVFDALQIHRSGHFRARFTFSRETSSGEWNAP